MNDGPQIAKLSLESLTREILGASRVVIETPNALGLSNSLCIPAKCILDSLADNGRRIEALEAENAALREQMLAIRCNTDPSTFGTLCDLPESTSPHSYTEHLEAQLRIINMAARAALARQTEGEG